MICEFKVYVVIIFRIKILNKINEITDILALTLYIWRPTESVIKKQSQLIINRAIIKQTQQQFFESINSDTTMEENANGQYSAGKKIYTIKVKAAKNYNPFQYMNPYQYLDQLNKSIKRRGLDIDVVEVKYLQTRSKAQKGFESYDINRYDFQVEKDKNNVFNSSNSFLDWIFSDSVSLKKPETELTQAFDNIIEEEKKKEEDKKITDIDKFLENLMTISEGTKKKEEEKEKIQISTIERFKNADCNVFKEGDYNIFIKAVMSEPLKIKLLEQKDNGKGFSIEWKGSQIRSFLHPAQVGQSNRVQQLAKISSFALGCSAPEVQPVKESQNGSQISKYYYFNSEKLEPKIQIINQSVNINSYIAINRQSVGSDTIKSFEIQTYYFNKSVIKTQVNMGQIKKIEIYDGRSAEGVIDYYFYLAYPPKFFIQQLRTQLATSMDYMVNWERIQNIFFLRNKKISKNQFLRLYLFNNTILKITVDKKHCFGLGQFEKPVQMLSILKQKFDDKISIPITHVHTRIKFEWGLKALDTGFDYEKGFLRSLGKVQEQNKVWILKYFILIMVRYDHLYPSQINQIIRQIEQCHDDLDVFIYVFWKIATDMWGYTDKEKRFSQYLFEQVKSAKALSRTHMMKKIIKNTDMIAHVFKMNVAPSGFLYTAPNPEMKGRLLKEYDKQSEYFMRVSVCDDHQGTLKNQKYITKGALKSKMLKFSILGRQYIPLGWSPSQLRAYSLWYMHQVDHNAIGKKINRQRVLNFLGSFQSIQNPAKRAARIGQSFSASWTFDATKIRYKEQEDIISQNGFNFTDGIGKISKDLIESISLKLGLSELAIIQVRYLGAKGILVLDETLPRNTIVLRPSMIKYKCGNESAAKYLDILDVNKYKSGFLNRQVIILLKTLKIHDKVFQQLQKTHIQNISQMSFKDCSVFKQMNDDLNTEINNLQPANKTILSLVRAGFDLQTEPFFRGVLQTMKKNGYNQLKNKCNIRIDKSARIIGIIDEYGVLQENEVYCAIYDPFSTKKQSQKLQIIDEGAIITRNPCLDPADIRVVKCIGRAQIQARFQKYGYSTNKFEKILNVVIFPKKGKVPLTAQISGSDLDGDNFFICWDQTLVPKDKEVRKIKTIDNPNTEKKNSKPASFKKEEQMYKEMMQFFFEYINYEKLGQIDNSHLVKADGDDTNYADNKDCQKLCQIHGKAVDFPKTGYCPEVDPKLLVSIYPDFMEKEGTEQYCSQSILGKLYRQIKSKIQDLLKDKVYKGQQVIDVDLIKYMDINYTKQEVNQAMLNLLDYEKSLANLVKLVGIETEYEIYSGNFSIAKEKVDQYGKTRLISTILQLKQKHFQAIFDDMPEDENNYHQVKEQNLEKENTFSQQAKRRAILYYLVSYIYKFGQKLKFPIHTQKLDKIRYWIKICLEGQFKLSTEGKFCGFIWFIIPKIIINIKRLATIKDREQKLKDQANSKKKLVDGEKTEEKTGENQSQEESNKDSDNSQADQKI